jgi:hypothetical protein
MENFENVKAAFDAMELEIDDSCIDNHRFARVDCNEDMSTYLGLRDAGCCGFFDRVVTIGGEKYMIGCNYGH